VGEAKDSGANALNLEQLVAKFEKRKGWKKGVRTKIEEIVNRCCEIEEGGWLKWKA
jgi:3-hydroxyisobutyryl-CoA hydrolase